MKFISLFSGVGGFDLGLERAGMECVAQVELGSNQSSILARHFPDAMRFKDVKHVGKHNLPTADLICGGSPCQDVSVAGDGAGLVGEQSKLFFEFVRILQELKPTWFIFENVPGLLSVNRGRDFATVLLSLAKCGYGVAYRVLDAHYFGVAQRRRRVFVVGSLGDGRSAEILFERANDTQHSPTGDIGEVETSTSTAKHLGSIGEPMTPIAFDYRAGDDSKWQTGANGGHRTGGAKQIVRAGSYVGTINATRQDAVAGVFGVRRLTPRDCERLQGFPDDFTAIGADGEQMSDNARLFMLGNAVAVPVIEWIGKRLACGGEI